MYRMKLNWIMKMFSKNSNQKHAASLIYGNGVCSKCQYNQMNKSFYVDYKPFAQIRFFSNYTKGKGTPLPNLTDFPLVSWPRLGKVIKDTLVCKLLIEPYYDKTFSLREFIAGSKHAVGVVSGYLSNANFRALDELVTPDLIHEIKANMRQFSLRQMMELRINPDDIYFSCPYNIVLLQTVSDDNRPIQILEISMCFHALTGYKEIIASPNISLKSIDYENKLQILNYRFFKEVTKNENGEWTINALNHFKPLITDAFY